MPHVHMQLVPTGAEFRTSLAVLPETMADWSPQLHVEWEVESEKSHARLETVAWDTLAAVSRERRRGQTPLGFVDHVIDQEGRKLRVIRVLFPN